MQRCSGVAEHEQSLRGGSSAMPTTAAGGSAKFSVDVLEAASAYSKGEYSIEKGSSEWRTRMKAASADVQWIDAVCFGAQSRMKASPYGPAGSIVELPPSHSLWGCSRMVSIRQGCKSTS